MYHKMRDGSLMKIEQMKDAHLIHSINYLIKKLITSKEIIEGKFDFSASLSGSTHSKENAMAYASEFVNNISNYFFECLVRDLDITKEIAEVKEIIRSSRDNIKGFFVDNKELDKHKDEDIDNYNYDQISVTYLNS